MVILCIICSKCMWLDILVFALQSMNLLDALLVWNVFSVNLLLGLCIIKLLVLASCHFLYEAVLVECLKIDDLFIQLGVFPLTTWQKLKSTSSWSKFFIDIVILCMIYWIFVCMILVLLSSTIFICWSVFARLLWWWKDCYESFIRAEGHILGLLKFLSLILIRVPMKVYMELYGPS